MWRWWWGWGAPRSPCSGSWSNLPHWGTPISFLVSRRPITKGLCSRVNVCGWLCCMSLYRSFDICRTIVILFLFSFSRWLGVPEAEFEASSVCRRMSSARRGITDKILASLHVHLALFLTLAIVDKLTVENVSIIDRLRINKVRFSEARTKPSWEGLARLNVVLKRTQRESLAKNWPQVHDASTGAGARSWISYSAGAKYSRTSTGTWTFSELS